MIQIIGARLNATAWFRHPVTLTHCDALNHRIEIIRRHAMTAPMTDTPPDRLSLLPSSPFHDEALLARGIGVRFRGIERGDVVEYSLSEGWIRVSLAKKVDRKGQPLTLKLSGTLEVWFERAADDAAEAVDTTPVDVERS